MRKVYMLPTPTQAQTAIHNSINQIVLRLQQHLPAYGWEITENEADADLVAGNAGQSGARGWVDVAIVHGVMPTGLPQGVQPEWFAVNRLVARNIITAKAVTVPSEWVADILRRDMGIDPHVIPWAINPAEWYPETGKHEFTLWNKTRIDAVCDPSAVHELAARYPHHKFVTTHAKTKPTPNVAVIGTQPFDLMQEYIRGAHVFLSTVKETFGIATLEAMASGVPVLGWAEGGNLDIVQHGVNGFLAQPGDYDALAAGFEYVIRHRDVLSANARQTAQAYTWERTASRFAALFSDVYETRHTTKVSVVIPHYNYQRFLPEALMSACQQETDFQYEVLVVDDGSADDPTPVFEAAVRQIDGNRPRNLASVKLLRKPNSGVANTRNYGIRHADGEYIVCLDADDRLGSPRFLQALADALDADRALGIAFAGLTVMDEGGTLSNNLNPWPNGFDYERHLQGHNQVPTCCMFRRVAWQRAGGYRKEVQPAEDANLWTRICALGYGAKHVTQEGWFHYRLHSNSLSSETRGGKKPEPNWRAFPWVNDGRRPFAAQGARASYPVRHYDNPLVSVIIPVGKGHEHLLPRALDSVEAQTFRNWQCIVVNDTGEPLPLIGYAWVRIVDGPRKNAASARNAGVRAATAPLIAFLDADDLLLPTFIDKCLKRYMETGRYIYTDWLAITKDGRMEAHQTRDFVEAERFKQHSFHSINVLMRRDDFMAAGGFDEAMNTWEDVEFFMRLATRGVCGARVREPLTIYDYRSGFVRELGEAHKDDVKAYIRQKFEPWIEGRNVCGCHNKPQGKPVSSSAASASDESVAEMIRIEYQGPKAGHNVSGLATRTFYGYRQAGDYFKVYAADMQAQPDIFIPAPEYSLPAPETVIPPEPERIGA